MTEADACALCGQPARAHVKDHSCSMFVGKSATADVAEKERAAVVAFARRMTQVHHRIAAENEHLRTQHIALSSAYISVADAIESGEHLKEGR